MPHEGSKAARFGTAHIADHDAMVPAPVDCMDPAADPGGCRVEYRPERVQPLHHEFGHKRSTLTNVVDRLERRGFVRREVNPRDRRSFVVHLTASGRPVARCVTRALATLDGELAALVEQRDLAGVEAVVASLDGIARQSAPAAR